MNDHGEEILFQTDLLQNSSQRVKKKKKRWSEGAEAETQARTAEDFSRVVLSAVFYEGRRKQLRNKRQQKCTNQIKEDLKKDPKL